MNPRIFALVDTKGGSGHFDPPKRTTPMQKTWAHQTADTFVPSRRANIRENGRIGRKIKQIAAFYGKRPLSMVFRHRSVKSPEATQTSGRPATVPPIATAVRRDEQRRSSLDVNLSRWDPSRLSRRQSASLSVSPVRMRTAFSIGVTNTLPSPIWPVRAPAVMT